ncbi:PAS domain-containing protein [Myxococcus sp. CA051A]|uniref:histidine kinase n=1 Tax=Myxococcus llanfairpwllgwyngyllgogerychwyrndrobwllllantysiliogogogochensis TaxID=2590453 RepID=A0A540X9L5_9BACT|nr:MULTISPECIES: PAS domain-containing protein [Myxococcus]NTX02635.1 PAS domain-containing protein [Myxococcus sp. CA040A]NTX11056.1 PAS domain-containing protein [Myxococcus sp. CA056]NTX40847.1 PAS domain-containing protein [Myxococcus sp. CA033]NTX50438.1 PAS domain-containing protein [Myxococcus sp. CA039A]NTX60331.1 PAS domain-containing protein [Myxococcus sp. CA051A]
MPQSLLHPLPGGPLFAVAPEEAWPFLGAVLNATGCGIALLDRELRTVWVNGALASLSGMEMRAHLGRPLVDLWPKLAVSLAPLLSRALSGESVVEAPVTGVLSSTSGERSLRVALSPAHQAGVLTGVVMWMRDDTARTHEEARLRERESHMRSLADVACDGHFLHENGVVLDANRALAHLLGHDSPRDLIGHHLIEWVSPEYRPAVMSAVARGVETPYEVMCVRRDGQRIPLEVLGKHVLWEGRQVRLAAIWDISGRKAAEERTERTEHFREQLLGVVGNDLRTPLQTIQMGTGALQRLGGMEEPQQRLVGHMAQAARRMERMIHELLDFTRARLAGGLPVRPESLMLDRLVERVLDERRQAHPGRTLLMETQGDLRGHWDEARLTQLADTLLGSVLQHSTDTTPVWLKLVGSVGGVTLSIRNDSLTVPVEEHATLFEPFRRGRPASAEGLGLGLYIARQVAVAHGGRLTVESSQGGTRFVVWLPREPPGR